MGSAVFDQTPTVTAFDNRNQAVREIGYHRHPNLPPTEQARITRHSYNACSCLSQTADPRLERVGVANFINVQDLAGRALRNQSVDAGTSVTLSDCTGRSLFSLTNIGTGPHGQDDRGEAVNHNVHYELAHSSGRPTYIIEGMSGDTPQTTERFLYAGTSSKEKHKNVAGTIADHYDPAGKVQTLTVALSGAKMCIQRQLLKFAGDENLVADWKGQEPAEWDDLLSDDKYLTRTASDATGTVLTTLDAAGNEQRIAFNLAGSSRASWLTICCKAQRAIVKSVEYAASGQKLREHQSNGVVTTSTYDAQTLRLLASRVERREVAPKLLQSLSYAYDPFGNLITVTSHTTRTRYWRNQKVVPRNEYIYDSLYQLVSTSGREMASIGQQGQDLPSGKVAPLLNPSTYTNYIRTYSYDDSGNLNQIRHSVPGGHHGYTRDVTISNSSNRGVLATLTENPAEVNALYTPGGHQRLLLAGQPLQWTLRGELRQAAPDGVQHTEHYRYGGDNQRVLKVNRQQQNGTAQTQRTVYLPGLEIRTVRTGSTDEQRLLVLDLHESGGGNVRALHWALGKPDGISDCQVRWSYNILNGSSELELDELGNIISHEEYYPYGGTAILTARNQVEVSYKFLHFNGKEQDATGLYYHGYRYYQPWVGRWLSADPAGPMDGVNLFRMAQNNPVTLKDADGLAALDQLFAPDRGDLIYGLGPERIKTIQTSRMLDKYSKEKRALLIDDYNAATGISIHMLTKVDSSSIASQKEFMSTQGSQAKLNAFALQSTSQLAPQYPLWNSYFTIGKIKPKFNIAGIYNEVQSQWGSTRFHGWRKDNYAPDLLLKRASKLGIEMAAAESGNHIHFLLDNLDIPAIINKKDDKGLFKTTYKGTSITASELRYAYRNRERLEGKIHFYKNKETVAAPWQADPTAWRRYVPKTGHQSRTAQ